MSFCFVSFRRVLFQVSRLDFGYYNICCWRLFIWLVVRAYVGGTKWAWRAVLISCCIFLVIIFRHVIILMILHFKLLFYLPILISILCSLYRFVAVEIKGMLCTKVNDYIKLFSSIVRPSMDGVVKRLITEGLNINI